MKILYFAWLREKVGRAEETIDGLPGDVATVADLIDHLAGKGGGYADAFAERSVIRAAVNQAHAELSQPLAPGDEVAFFPPVTGG